MTGNYTVGGKTVSLNQSDYKASGGEGVIYVKRNSAYKIYHDPKKMIPTGKIRELTLLNALPNVLAPQDIIYRGNIEVGFVMPYVSNTEFLCKLFTRGFRDKNGIDQNTINNLVKVIQKTTKEIHSNNVLIVDANEFNFLSSDKYDNVYFIDVDSYQTPSYRATALMDSVRDRKVINNQFTTLSDWFSIGVTMFQLYIGCHPYKGRHPDFSPKDWQKMMDSGISVFNRKCSLPPTTQDINVIPRGHLKWFESIFEKGERSEPPEADAMAPVAKVVAKIIQSNDSFNITSIRNTGQNIKSIRFIDGTCWILTDEAIWGDAKTFAPCTPSSGYSAHRTQSDICYAQNGRPVIVNFNRIENKLSFESFDNILRKNIGETESSGFFIANNNVYTVARDGLIEISFRHNSFKTSILQLPVANIFHNYKIFDGLVSQDMLGTCRFAIPYESGRCSIIRIKELDGCRIVDAKYDSGIAIVLSERGGKYERHTFIFDKKCETYSVRVEQDVNLQSINFMVKSNGVCIAENENKLEIFIDNSKVKLVDSPLNGGERLVTNGAETLIINDKSLLKVTSK